ncbi:MAG: thiamine-phosphate kinase [Phycisphaerae bacterium]|jgi:thiamine-monophosphate kinase
MREFDFIDWIRSQSRFDPAAVPLGPGDDMAVVTCGGENVLVTVDQVLDGTHFVLDRDGAQAAGRKAMARNLSDVAAMAAWPLCAVASVALPKGFSQADAQWLYQGMRSIGDTFACPLVGGDISSWDGRLAVSVTVLARPAGIAPVLRSGAQAGDAICVTGQLGGAWRSQRHLHFLPRIREARELASTFSLHAMIDISDGLSGDLGHLCRESGVGAEIEADKIPVHPDASLQAVGLSAPLSAALGDGEDYELLFTLPSDQADRLLREQPLDIPVTRIGAILPGQALTLIHPDGRRGPLLRQSWEHDI